MQKLSSDPPTHTLPARIKQGQLGTIHPALHSVLGTAPHAGWVGGYEGKSRQLLWLVTCHPVLPFQEQGSHTSNLPLALWSFSLFKEDGVRLNKRTSLNNDKKSLQTSWKQVLKEIRSLVSPSYFLFLPQRHGGAHETWLWREPQNRSSSNRGWDSLASGIRTCPWSLLEPVQFLRTPLIFHLPFLVNFSHSSPLQTSPE